MVHGQGGKVVKWSGWPGGQVVRVARWSGGQGGQVVRVVRVVRLARW